MLKTQQPDRIKVLQKALSIRHIDAAIINLSRDLFYYTGTAQPCLLLVTHDDYRLLVRRAHDFVMQETFLDKAKIEDKANLSDALTSLNNLSVKNGKLGLELDVIPAQLYLKMKDIFNKYELINISDDILQQRMKKDDQEIQDMQVACQIMDAGHQRVLKTLHPGMTELQLAAEVEYAHRRAGHEGVLSMRNFDFYISRGPLSSGKNLFKTSGFANTITGVGLSPAIPAGPSHSKINSGDLIIIDIPTCHKGYHCDQTRTYFLGNPANEIEELFKKLKEIFNTAISTLKAGIICRQMFEATYEKAQSLGVAQYFLGLEPRKGNFIGHGIGLDANEPPILFYNSEFQLLKNFVVTIELHLTHPEYGAVKLEDVVLVKENGCQILTITPGELFLIQS
ncbi:MAG: aminopeptidase P family protein [Desulfobacteraceae bacterium]|nr:aminopeptidase P family protein [Desulfobacteraceae bacterium]